ncbi:hypothetical protein ACFE04_022046 [Oxalis oulophora]
MDFTDLLSAPSTNYTTIKKSHQENEHATININDNKIAETPITNLVTNDLAEEPEEENFNIREAAKVVKPAVLRRNGSVSSSATVMQSAVKRAFSLRRSSSVLERYSRIHDQSVTILRDDDDVDHTRSGDDKQKKKKGFGIFKVCRKIFGL